MFFKENLIFLRKIRKISQKDLAKKVGVNQSSISLWEKGMDITIENAIKVAEALNIDFDIFITKDLSKLDLNSPNYKLLKGIEDLPDEKKNVIFTLLKSFLYEEIDPNKK